MPEWYGWYIRLSGVMCTFVDGQISSDALMQNQQRYCNWIGSNCDEIDLVMTKRIIGNQRFCKCNVKQCLTPKVEKNYIMKLFTYCPTKYTAGNYQVNTLNN